MQLRSGRPGLTHAQQVDAVQSPARDDCDHLHLAYEGYLGGSEARREREGHLGVAGDDVMTLESLRAGDWASVPSDAVVSCSRDAVVLVRGSKSSLDASVAVDFHAPSADP